ncbi:MAG: phage major capsid protein [Flavobacteriaceae bacterium]
MKRSVELRQQLAQKIDAMTVLDTKAEGRSFTEDEKAEFDILSEEVESIRTQITEAEKREAIQLAKATQASQERSKQPKEKEETKIAKKYSLLRAIDLITKGKQLDGLEGEMAKEAETEARASGLVTRGNLQIPSMLIKIPSFRDMTAGTTTAGGFTVPTDLGELIPILTPKLQTVAMGATTLTGLTSNIDFPRNDADAAAVWEGENDANAETSPTFDRIQLSPNRLGAFTDISKQVIIQSSIDMENFVRRRLNFAVSKAIDLAAINGSGSGNEPEGILNVSGIGDVDMGSPDGGAPTWAKMVEFQTDLETANADMGRIGFLTTPGVKGKLLTVEKASGTGQFILSEPGNSLLGYNFATSTQVPSTLTKGAGTNLHACIFGNWEELIIAQWAGIDIVVDPYTSSKNALITLVINSWWDVAVRHAASFVASNEINVT